VALGRDYDFLCVRHRFGLTIGLDRNNQIPKPVLQPRSITGKIAVIGI
jgi:hypothetical protein